MYEIKVKPLKKKAASHLDKEQRRAVDESVEGVHGV
jgi:hypothetical protein